MVRIHVVWFGVGFRVFWLGFVLHLGFRVGDFIYHRVGAMIIDLDQSMVEQR